MFRRLTLLSIIVCAAITLHSCGTPTPDDVAEKIERNASLNTSDYDVMLDYLQEATDAMVPRLKATRSVGDMEFVEADISKLYPLADEFNTALLRDFPNLTGSQTERIASMRRQAQEAVGSKKY